MKQFSPSADRNKDAILACLKTEIAQATTVLEIGSGTGQHVCHFAAQLPSITWIPSDLKPNLLAVKTRVQEANLNNVSDPVELDVNQLPWSIQHIDVCYTCNTLHIMSLDSVKSFFQGCQQVLDGSGKICVYGPFSIAGKHTADSNARFDQMLQQSDPLSGVRDLNELNKLAAEHHFTDARVIKMPANNLLLVWEATVNLNV